MPSHPRVVGYRWRRGASAEDAPADKILCAAIWMSKNRYWCS